MISYIQYEFIKELFDDCLKEVKNAGIKYGNIISLKIDNSKSRWGRCKKQYNKYREQYEYKISLSEQLLLSDEKGIKTTMIHEILHTASDDGHGKHWKELAEIMNNKYGYNIKRTTSQSEKNINKKFKYMIKCNHCGHESYFYNKCKVVDNYDSYVCKICKHGNLKLFIL